MKAYVTYYRTKTEEEKKDTFGPRSNVDIYFHKWAEWRIESAEDAKAECQYLRDMKVYVGEHFCDFSVEELPGGNFAIVCLSHPDWTKPDPART